MDVGKPRITHKQGRSFLSVSIDGEKAKISLEQKGWRDGVIFLGSQFEKTHSCILKADPSDGRPRDRIMKGCTDNAHVVQLYRDFRSRVLSG